MSLGFNKELLAGKETSGIYPIESFQRPRVETVIFDRTIYDLELVRKDIASFIPASTPMVDKKVVPSAVDIKVDFENRWKNVFNLRKLRMLN